MWGSLYDYMSGNSKPAPKPAAKPAPRPVAARPAPKPAPLTTFQHITRRFAPGADALSGVRANDPDASRACTNAYKSINQKNYHRIVVGFGYIDTIPGVTVFNPQLMFAFKQQLTSQCNRSFDNLCGFSVASADGWTLRKKVPTADGRGLRTIDLRMIGGALSGNYQNNISAANKETTMRLCKGYEESFHTEIENGANTVIYYGHSRNGGGPDFCPAITTADGKHVNYSVYQARREGINGLTDSLRTARKNGKKNELLALLSCSSKLHFRSRLAAAAPDMGMILTSRTVVFDHIYHDLLGLVTASVNQNCKEPLQDYLDNGESHGTKGGAVIYNFM